MEDTLNNNEENNKIFNMLIEERRKYLIDKSKEFKKQYFIYDNRERARINRLKQRLASQNDNNIVIPPIINEDKLKTTLKKNDNNTIATCPILQQNGQLFRDTIDSYFKKIKPEISRNDDNEITELINEIIQTPPIINESEPIDKPPNKKLPKTPVKNSKKTVKNSKEPVKECVIDKLPDEEPVKVCEIQKLPYEEPVKVCEIQKLPDEEPVKVCETDKIPDEILSKDTIYADRIVANQYIYADKQDSINVKISDLIQKCDDNTYTTSVIYADTVIAKNFILEDDKEGILTNPTSIKSNTANIIIPIEYINDIYISMPKNSNSHMRIDGNYCYISFN
jgi:hypothetical protein